MKCSTNTILASVLTYFTLHGVGGLNNLYIRNGFDGSITVYGSIFWNYSEYQPTCGWKLIMYATEPVANISGSAEFFNVTQMDNYTFILNGLSKYDNLVSMNPIPVYADIQVIGDYRSTTPNITVYWYCVCTLQTSGKCQMVVRDTPTTQLIMLPTTTTQSTTTSSSAKSTSITTTTLATAFPAVTTTSSALKSATLTKVIDLCQLNTLATVTPWNPGVFTCAIECLNYANCTGVNYWETTKRCDIVSLTSSSTGSSNTTFIPGCQYYIIDSI